MDRGQFGNGVFGFVKSLGFYCQIWMIRPMGIANIPISTKAPKNLAAGMFLGSA